MVDEMETFLHARPKALSVPMIVRVKTGEILGFAVAKMPAKGKLAQIVLININGGMMKDQRNFKECSLI